MLDVYRMIRHYDALYILIEYIKTKAREGDDVAKKTLVRWDEERCK